MVHLIPEKRVDKNGVARIKHVRATPRTSSLTKAPPAPRLTPAAKGLKLRPSQIEQRKQTFSGFAYDAHTSMAKRRKTPRGDEPYEFTASEAEIYDVLSVAHSGDAMVLMELGVRTADEARDYLTKFGETDLIVDNGELTGEMLKRNIAPKDYLNATNTSAKQVDFRAPFFADQIEFDSIQSFSSSFRRDLTRRHIYEGNLSLADIKFIGVSNLKKYDRLRGMHDTLIEYHKGKIDCSIEDMKSFVVRANNEQLVLGHFKDAVHLLRNLDRESIDEIESLSTFASLFNEKEEDIVAETNRAHYATVLLEGMEKTGGERSGRYWAYDFPRDVDTLRSAGISVKDAIPLMSEGMSAQQVVGVLNGVSVAVSEGWL